MKPILITHERLGFWARQLRPRISEWGFGLVESRSVEDLQSAAEKSACPIILVDFRDADRIRFEDLLITRITAPASLILVLIPITLPSLSRIMIEAGATAVLPGSAPPPEVLGQLQRWIELARTRTLADGWAMNRRAEPEPWELLLAEVSISPETSPAL